MGFFSTLWNGVKSAISPISAIAGLGSDILNTAMQNKTNKDNMRFAREQAQADRDFNAEQAHLNRDFQQQSIEQGQQFAVEQWNRENAYNDPSAMMQRYTAAGLNPNLVAGTIGGTGASLSPISSANGATASSSSSAPSQVAPTIGDLMQRRLDYERQRAEIDYIKSQKQGQDTQNNILSTFSSFQSALLEGDVRMKNANVRLSDVTSNFKEEEQKLLYPMFKKLDAETDSLRAGIDHTRALIENVNADTAGKLIDNFFKSKFWDASIKKIASETHLNYTQANDICRTFIHRIALMDAQAHEHNAGAENKIVNSIFTAADGQFLDVDADGNVSFNFTNAMSFGKLKYDIESANKVLPYFGGLAQYLGSYISKAIGLHGGGTSLAEDFYNNSR